jgi:lipoate-protein ligase B
MNKFQPVRACWLGRTPYREAWDLQAELVTAVRDGHGAGTLLLLEHPHVFTMGKAAKPDHILWDQAERARREVDVIWSDRGGEATYHGFALNLTTDLDYFDGIVPCGHADKRPTSVQSITGEKVETDAAARAYAEHFSDVFGAELEWGSAQKVLQAPAR